jgi:CBS domain-containing protein
MRSDSIRSIMTTDIKTIDIDADPSDVRALLQDHPFHHVPVVMKGKLAGILSSWDLARATIEPYNDKPEMVNAYLDVSFRLASLMSHDVVSVKPTDSVKLAAELLGEGAFHALPVVEEDGTLVGMVTSTDLTRYLWAELPG